MIASACANVNGTWSAELSCGEAVCSTVVKGACCVNDTCSALTPAECNAASGSYKGDGISCSGIDCGGGVPDGLGACCYKSGECYLESTLTCAILKGEFKGDGIACGADTCEAVGACCTLEGICETGTEEFCEGIGGGYLPATACGTFPCGLGGIQGACCPPSGSCQQTGETQCTGMAGTWTAMSGCFDVTCVPAKTGGCCLGDGTCAVMEDATCAVQGGIYVGPGTVCDPNPCDSGVVTGACCFNGTSCFDGLTSEDCLDISPTSVFAGPGSSCDDDDNSGVPDVCE